MAGLAAIFAESGVAGLLIVVLAVCLAVFLYRRYRARYENPSVPAPMMMHPMPPMMPMQPMGMPHDSPMPMQPMQHYDHYPPANVTLPAAPLGYTYALVPSAPALRVE